MKHIPFILQWGLVVGLVIAKLSGSIGVSWWVVFAPIWVPWSFALLATITIMLALLAVVVGRDAS